MTSETPSRETTGSGPGAGWREIQHTADTGLEVWGQTLAELLREASKGMLSVVADTAGIESRLTRTVRASGASPEELLVNWLSELNFLHQTHGELYAAFDLAPVHCCRAVGKVRGEKIDPRRHRLYTEVKGVTYHGLRVTQGPDGWYATVILDV